MAMFRILLADGERNLKTDQSSERRLSTQRRREMVRRRSLAHRRDPTLVRLT
ncbi:hypothetical protein [Bradyrhizobium sp. 1(2017)]|jgi:hypothetical protein|uniref:hypothetical protein n=1 Tax=Bradyrhizobium sp. 1(2017) TaxID=1404888 RepID=UPI00140E9C02|nr:hypothetical protein [Bradyrhizobium sp. 1(2017)]QIO33411.1 hypothetical protein HAP40_17135 [Bradyrhizobium sp. 1(2017)]